MEIMSKISSNDEKESLASQISLNARSIPKRRGIKSYDQMQEYQQTQPRRSHRWRMLSRVFIHFLRWEKIRSSGKDRGFVMRRMVAGRVQERVFDVALFSKVVQQHQILTIHSKLLLFKEPEKRSSQDLVVALGYMNRMKCFDKFSVPLKRQLAAKIQYNCYKKGTVIFTEGSCPMFFYLILSGSVQLYKNVAIPSEPQETCQDPIQGRASNESIETVIRPQGKPIDEGSGFGEIGLLDDTPRAFTVITAEHCECFTLRKKDFAKLLATYHDEERSMKTNAIRNIPQIEGVSDNDIKRAIDSSFFKKFAKGEVIVRGEDFCLSNQSSEVLKNRPVFLDTYAHVVVSGCAVLEKRIYLHQEPLPCGTTIARLPKNSINNTILAKVTKRVRASVFLEQPPQLQGKLSLPPPPPVFPTLKYLSVCSYVPGDIFLPFVLEENYVIGAKEATTILYLPKTPFMLHKSGETMVKLFDELTFSKITVDDLLKEYNSGRIWKDYRKQLVRQVLVDKLLRKSYS